MPDFLGHVESLISPSQDHSGDRALERWISLEVSDKGGNDGASELSEDQEASCQATVLDLYRSQNAAEAAALLRGKLMSRLLSEPKLQPILSHLHAALASRASNEAISEDLFDMMGYDDMDMIVEILDNRSFIAAELEAALKNLKIGRPR
ncbi:hypothetical protein BC826DRAFT_1100832 [Russula brevipes]|nr:hypothetical protein BC826DRAFT_1100832 [Russula brevipes]